MSSVVLFLWHNPLSESDLYGHVFNLINLLRYCMYPVLALLTNASVRKQFVPGMKKASVISFSNYPTSR
ncbi:hypothetical protein OESDEN_00600 [Oesophagostomum dentatum]|uniref:Uncharacterized protein n=1 Tax=Oesophagostomum dentatum TaxID=61180 RepID=A0A0B1TVD7_OESDE|nr:hypothetical protein OESDEN_00600 [Oesophagostomum dentatum]